MLDKLFGKTGTTTAAPTDQMVIVDGPSVYGTRQGRLSPKDQISILHRLAKVVTAEKWELCVVFEGEPLRKIGSGDQFEDKVTVFFAPTADDFLDLAVKQAKAAKKRKAVVTITSDKDLTERMLALGVPVLRSTLFRKAFDRLGGGGGGGNQKPRRRRRRNDGEGVDDKEGKPREKGGSNRRRNSNRNNNAPVKPKDAVSDLIDLVE